MTCEKHLQAEIFEQSRVNFLKRMWKKSLFVLLFWENFPRSFHLLARNFYYTKTAWWFIEIHAQREERQQKKEKSTRFFIQFLDLLAFGQKKNADLFISSSMIEKTMICKPAASSQGDGIFLFDDATGKICFFLFFISISLLLFFT